MRPPGFPRVSFVISEVTYDLNGKSGCIVTFRPPPDKMIDDDNADLVDSLEALGYHEITARP